MQLAQQIAVPLRYSRAAAVTLWLRCSAAEWKDAGSRLPAGRGGLHFSVEAKCYRRPCTAGCQVVESKKKLTYEPRKMTGRLETKQKHVQEKCVRHDVPLRPQALL